MIDRRGGRSQERVGGKSSPPSRLALLASCLFLVGAGLGTLIFFIEQTWSNAPPRGPRALEPLPDAKPGSRAADLFPHYRRGLGFLAAERYSEAYVEFTQAARLAPEDPRPIAGRGDVLRNFDRNELAEAAYRRALDLEADYAPAKKALARVLYEVGGYEEASALLEELLRRDPDDPDVLQAMARVEMRTGHPERAASLLRRYCEAGGDAAWGHAHLGRAHAEAGDPQAAEKAYRRALEIHPKAVLCHLWLGQLLVSLGRRDEAEPLLEAYQQLRRWQGEERRAKRDLFRRPDDVLALAKLAFYRHRLGNNRKAIVPLRRALELLPKESPDYSKLLDLKRLIEKELAPEAKRR